MIRTAVAAILCLCSASGAAFAQNADKGEEKSTPLRLQVVLTRYKGDTKVSSMPYSVWVNVKGPSDNSMSDLQIGMQVPISVMANNTQTVAFKDVGNRVNTNVTPLSDGRYRVAFQIEQSALDNAPGSVVDSSRSGMPVLRSFRTNFTIVLRDGQSAQSTSATDPVTGELLKVDVTLNLVK